jgi:hypothetical protein
MDVAQILNENANKVLDQPASKTFPPAPVLHESSMEPAPETETELALATARPQNIVPSQTEKRKSSYEKYSSFMMPPLLEEKTPAASPAGTLSRSVGDLSRSTPIELLETASTVLEDKPVAEAKSPEDKLIHFDIRADPLPTVDIAALLNTKNTSFAFNSSDTEVISLEVLAVASHIATPIKEDHDIFYDSEVLAVIQRAKSRSTGLVKTTVWGWRGQQGKLGDQEAQKLREISKRYGTSLLLVEQSEERVDLLHALGGKLAVRNGQRSLWSADNTSMHIVQKVGEVVIIEERELVCRWRTVTGRVELLIITEPISRRPTCAQVSVSAFLSSIRYMYGMVVVLLLQNDKHLSSMATGSLGQAHPWSSRREKNNPSFG